MAQNRDLLARMYGTKAPPKEPARVTIDGSALPLVWILALVTLGAASVAVALGTLAVGMTSGGGPLEAWGVLAPEDLVLVVHDHSAARDGSAGCVVTQDRLVRWSDRRPDGAVPLRGATIDVEEAGVRAANGDASLLCPYGPGEDPLPLAAAARRLTSR